MVDAQPAEGRDECLICGADLVDSPVVGTSDRAGNPISNAACLRCGFVQRCPMPTQGELDVYYAQRYWADARSSRPVITVHPPDGSPFLVSPDDERYAKLLCHQAMYRVTMMEDLLADTGTDAHTLDRVLDLGCGEGRTLIAAAKRWGRCIHGLEPDAQSVSALREMGHPVQRGSVEDIDGPYQLIYAFHVLEHLRHPRQGLERMRDALVVGGRILLEVPAMTEMAAPSSGWWQYAHLHEFTIPHMAMLIRSVPGLSTVYLGRDIPGRLQVVLARDDSPAEAFAMPRSWPIPPGRQVAARIRDADRRANSACWFDVPTNAAVLGEFLRAQGLGADE